VLQRLPASAWPLASPVAMWGVVLTLECVQYFSKEVVVMPKTMHSHRIIMCRLRPDRDGVWADLSHSSHLLSEMPWLNNS